jgi:DNA-binding LacI/PurR family transcriptional regulator
MSESVDLQKLVIALENVLSLPPSKAGLRLVPERELAAFLGTHRKKITAAFDILVQKGVLLKQRGSGSYVRKVPRIVINSDAIEINNRVLSANNLFARAAKTPVRKAPPQEYRRLHLSLLAGAWNSHVYSTIIEGIRSQIEVAGHELQAHHLEIHDRTSLNRFIKKVRNAPCDGCFLLVGSAHLLKKIFPSNPPPAVYIGSNTREEDVAYKPLVRLGTDEAFQRGMKLLTDEGFHKVGFITVATSSKNNVTETDALYERAIKRAGLSFRSFARCSLDDKRGIVDAMSQMFVARKAPEAVFVGDDILLGKLLPVWKKMNIVPGENLAVITLSNRGSSLPPGFDWSRLEFNPFRAGSIAVDSLLLEIQKTGETMCSLEMLAEWLPGKTHLRQKLTA